MTYNPAGDPVRKGVARAQIQKLLHIGLMSEDEAAEALAKLPETELKTPAESFAAAHPRHATDEWLRAGFGIAPRKGTK